MKMHRNSFIGVSALYLLALLPVLHGARAVRAPSPSKSPVSAQELPSHAIYDSDPKHIWNRIFQVFYVRQAWDGQTYGGDQLDPYLWEETKYLIEGPSHKQALALLDEFLSTHAERLITEPLKRAVLQRDLWAVFGWLNKSHSKNQTAIHELQAKIAQVMRRLALTPEQIRGLPDSFAAAATSRTFPAEYDPLHRDEAFLPPDLFSRDGPWVCLGMAGGTPAASAHSGFFGGRSVFLVFLRLPEGRASTLAYLKQLRDFPDPMIPVTEDFYPLAANAGVGRNSVMNRVPNPGLPQFPVGTEVALVRKMALIDDHGDWVPTPVSESVQLRVFTNIPSRADWLANRFDGRQDAFEFSLERLRLFSNQTGGLRALTRSDRDFAVFLTLPMDFLEKGAGANPRPLPSDQMWAHVLDTCVGCHAAPGIHAMLAPRTIWSGLSESHSLFFESSPAEQITATNPQKMNADEWVKLKQFWK